MTAADISVADFRARFSEFGSVADELVSQHIPQAYELSDISEEATLYCLAHLLALHPTSRGKADGGAGEVTSDRIGPKTQAFMTQAETNREVFFTSTPYGRRMLALETRNIAAVVGVRT